MCALCRILPDEQRYVFRVRLLFLLLLAGTWSSATWGQLPAQRRGRPLQGSRSGAAHSPGARARRAAPRRPRTPRPYAGHTSSGNAQRRRPGAGRATTLVRRQRRAAAGRAAEVAVGRKLPGWLMTGAPPAEAPPPAAAALPISPLPAGAGHPRKEGRYPPDGMLPGRSSRSSSSSPQCCQHSPRCRTSRS